MTDFGQAFAPTCTFKMAFRVESPTKTPVDAGGAAAGLALASTPDQQVSDLVGPGARESPPSGGPEPPGPGSSHMSPWAGLRLIYPAA